MNIEKFSRTPSLKNICKRLLLKLARPCSSVFQINKKIRIMIIANYILNKFNKASSQQRSRYLLNRLFSLADVFNFNPFSTNFPLLYPLKTSEKLQFSDVFRGYRSGTLVQNGVIRIYWTNCNKSKHDKCA